MIIVTDSTPQSPDKGTPPRLPQSGPTPPSYQATTQGYNHVHPVYQASIPLRVNVIPPPVHYQSPRRRFFKAFLVAVLIWVLLGMFARSVMELAYWNHRHGSVVWPDDIPISIDIGNCETDWQDIPHHTPSTFPSHSTTTFDLPVSADVLLFLARGSASGDLAILPSTEAGDTARVTVIVSYYHEYVRDRAKVCEIERNGGGAGVGIFTPSAWRYPSLPREENLKFSVVVTLPASGTDVPRPIRDFEVDTPLFSLSAAHLEGAIDFRNLTLISSNMPIGVESLYAAHAFIKTSNAPIAGSFNTSSSLALVTSNSPIKVDVGLRNDDKQPTSVFMKSSNGLIHSSVSLLRDRDQSSGGKYNVSAITSNSNVQIDFPVSPVDSTLKLDAITSNSGATVLLHPAFEGQFDLISSLFRPVVEKSTVTDPSGRGRRRAVEYSSYTRALVSGKVKWAGSTKRDGKVLVKSSNAQVVLKL